MNIPKMIFPDSDLSYKPEVYKHQNKPTTAIDTQAQSKIFLNGDFSTLRSCRLQVQNPQTFEVTSYYITRTDKDKFRVKVFCGGKCLLADYVKAESFAEILLNTKF